MKNKIINGLKDHWKIILSFMIVLTILVFLISGCGEKETDYEKACLERCASINCTFDCLLISRVDGYDCNCEVYEKLDTAVEPPINATIILGENEKGQRGLKIGYDCGETYRCNTSSYWWVI